MFRKFDVIYICFQYWKLKYLHCILSPANHKDLYYPVSLTKRTLNFGGRVWGVCWGAGMAEEGDNDAAVPCGAISTPR